MLSPSQLLSELGANLNPNSSLILVFPQVWQHRTKALCSSARGQSPEGSADLSIPASLAMVARVLIYQAG